MYILYIYNKNFLTNLQTNFSTHNSQINFSIYLFMYVCICKHVHHYVQNGRDTFSFWYSHEKSYYVVCKNQLQLYLLMSGLGYETYKSRIKKIIM